jgi:hypothetical protein
MINNMDDKTTAVISLTMAILFSFLMAFPVMLVWNHVLTDAVDGVNPISYWGAFGLTWLFQFLFKDVSPKKS